MTVSSLRCEDKTYAELSRTEPAPYSRLVLSAASVRMANEGLGWLSASLTSAEIKRAQCLARHIGSGNRYIVGAGLDFDGCHWRRQIFGDRSGVG